MNDGLTALEVQHDLVQQAWRKMNKAQRRDWYAAVSNMRLDLMYQARRLRACLDTLPLNDHRLLDQPPAPRQLLEELRQLEEEFEAVEFLPDNKLLITASTQPIELEGVALGRFVISLHLDRLGHPDSACFHCTALDPNPASGDDSVTHPHVKDEGLCAGDASAPIAAALREGRIADAFCLVRSVLHSYNPGSPYIALDDWNGVRCEDCDCTVGRDDRIYCEACQRDVCDECTGRCDVCDCSYCRGCLEQDRVSERDCCPGCRSSCGKCHRTVDSDNFDSESELCPECLAAQRAAEQAEADASEDSIEDPTDQTMEKDDETKPQPPTAPSVAAA